MTRPLFFYFVFMFLLLNISIHKQWTAVIVEVKTKGRPPDCYVSEHTELSCLFIMLGDTDRILTL